MESSLKNACKIKIQNFEGPLDLLFHLITKNKFNIYDIPIDEITNQYMDYLFAMQKLDLEIASEFLVMASTLLHIKSRLLIPNKRGNEEIEKDDHKLDPKEELILKLIEYKKHKEFSQNLKKRELLWSKTFYKMQEIIKFKWERPRLNLVADDLKAIYNGVILSYENRVNDVAPKMMHILQQEKVSLKSKMQEVIKKLFDKVYFKFSEMFSQKHNSRLQVITGFMAILELSKLKKINIIQSKPFSDILVYRTSKYLEEIEEEKTS